MSPLSNANYNKIVNVIYTIVSDKLHRINEAGINKRMEKNEPIESPVLIILPFKDQKSADSVRKQLNDLGKKLTV